MYVQTFLTFLWEMELLEINANAKTETGRKLRCTKKSMVCVM
jgi:hypothetical protein